MNKERMREKERLYRRKKITRVNERRERQINLSTIARKFEIYRREVKRDYERVRVVRARRRRRRRWCGQTESRWKERSVGGWQGVYVEPGTRNNIAAIILRNRQIRQHNVYALNNALLVQLMHGQLRYG